MNGNIFNDDQPIEEKLPYPTRPMYFPNGASVEEFIIPEEDKEIVLEQLYPFSPVPKLDDTVYDLHGARVPRHVGARHELSRQPVLSRKRRHGH